MTCPACSRPTAHHPETIYGTRRPEYCSVGCIADRIASFWQEKGFEAEIGIDKGSVRLVSIVKGGREVRFE